ncbi:MAG: gliding motility-associated C-terminal domain-containing protein [Bacteroidota bacterium]
MKRPLLSCIFLPFRLSVLLCTVFSLSQDAIAQCTGLGSITLNVVAAPEPDITGNTSFCSGASTVLSVANTFDTYEWSTGATGTPSITVTTPGTYSVVVSNATGCTGTDEVEVTLLPDPEPDITAAPYQCNGEFTLDAGGGFTTYTWSTTEGTQNITVNTSGTYTVTVTNADGCTGTDDFLVTIPTTPVVNITGDPNYCEGESTTLEATAGFVSYDWTGGVTGPVLTVSNPGTYGVTATDSDGCTAEASVVISENPFTQPTIDGNSLLCPGSTNILTAEGPNYISYAWSNNQITQSITIGSAGQYTVTVTAANGCTGTASIDVQLGDPAFTSINGSTILCPNNVLNLTATGSFNDYAWSTGATTQTITVGQIGTYSVTVTTAQGCTGTAETTITAGTPPVVNINPFNPIFCENAPPFQLTAQPPGGDWSGDVDPNGFIDPSTLGVGNFNAVYTFTDPNGCVGSDQAPFEVQALTAVNIQPAGPFCATDPVQQLVGTPPGGVWGGVANANGEIDPAALGPGFHVVNYTATGPGSCAGTAELTIEVYDLPTAVITGNGVICQGSGQSIFLDFITTGNGPFELTYTINGANPTTIIAQLGVTTISTSTPGIYEISSVEDANGCPGTVAGQSSVVEVTAPQVTGFDLICEPGTNSYYIVFGITGGDPGSYQINSPINGVLTGPPYVFTSDLIPSGDPYEFIVTDANVCDPVTLEGTFDCACETEVGTMDVTPLQLCEGETAAPVYNGGETLDANDVLVYILHDGNGNSLGNIFQVNTVPTFDFAPPLVFEQIYYISAVAGDDDGAGGVDLNDPCLSVSFGSPVSWSALPDGSFISGAEICEGENATLTFSLTGTAPFDVAYSDGTQQITLQNIFDNHSVLVSPLITTNYILESVEDSSPGACSANVFSTVTVTVNLPITQNLNATICEGESILLGGMMQTEAGTYTDSLSTVAGCDSIIVTELTVNLQDSVFLTDTSCDPTQAGVFEEILTNQNGCDSVVTTTVSFVEADSSFLTDVTCDPAQAGIFEETFTNQEGCDSIVTTTVSLLPNDTTALFSTSCDITQTGVFEETLSNQLGCDSIVITTITFSDTDSTFFADTTCDPSLAGVFEETFVNQLGCDSVVTTTVDLLASDTIELFDISCDSTQAGVFEEVFTNQSGCDSVVISTITFQEVDSTFQTDTTCDPNAVGVFTETFSNQFGCDSVVTTTVSPLPIDVTELFETTCDQAQEGVFTEVLTNQFGCDSTVITTVDFIESDATDVFGTSCNPANVGVFTETLTNQFGCDSIVTTTITLSDADSTFFTGTTCDPVQAGIFIQNLTSQFGCDSIVTTTIDLLAADTSFTNDTTCDPAQVGVFEEIFTNQNGCDSVVFLTVDLLAADTSFANDTTCDPAQAGVFEEIFTNLNGCDSVVFTTVTLTDSPPTFLTDQTCNAANAGIFTEMLTNQFGCDSIVITEVELLPNDTVFVLQSVCEVQDTGTVITTLTNQFGCDSIIVSITDLLPANECNVEFLLTGDIIPCGSTTGSIEIEITQGELPLNYDYISSNGNAVGGVIDASPFTLSQLPAGDYTITLTLANGQSNTQTISIEEAVPPVVDVTLTNALDCTGDPIASAEAIITGGAAPFLYLWSNGATTSDINNLPAGTYEVTVSDANNCEAVSSLDITAPTAVELSLVISNPNCFDANSGSIVAEATGGILPYQYSINGSDYQDNNSFAQLSAGAFEIMVQDADGCEASETVLINAPVPVDVDLGDDLTIDLGDNTTITALVNVPESLLSTITWTGIDSVECPTCLSQPVAPVITTTYSIFVESLDGCSDEDALTLFVDRQRQVYIPNAFSPNGDGTNERFYPFAKSDAVLNIKSFMIFSRWGETVFQATDIQPNIPDLGWDGTHRGEPMNPAVFVWFAEIEFVDGQTVLFEGEVILIR